LAAIAVTFGIAERPEEPTKLAPAPLSAIAPQPPAHVRPENAGPFVLWQQHLV
jgi:hypothetical protein